MEKYFLFIFIFTHVNILKAQQSPPQNAAVSSPIEKMDASGNPDLFHDYESWPNSSSLKTEDQTAKYLYLLSKDSLTAPRSTHVDINGDGLTDIIYHGQSFRPSNSSNPGKEIKFFAIIINKGNLQYSSEYKCVFKYEFGGPDNIAVYTWYGDCAEPN